MPHVLIIEHFSIECHQTKPKVITWPIKQFEIPQAVIVNGLKRRKMWVKSRQFQVSFFWKLLQFWISLNYNIYTANKSKQSLKNSSQLELEAFFGLWGQSLWVFLLWVELPHHLQFFLPKVTTEFFGAAATSCTDVSGMVRHPSAASSLTASCAIWRASSSEMPSSSPYVCLILHLFTFFFLKHKRIVLPLVK